MLTVGQLLMLYAKYPMPKTIKVNLFMVKNHLECAPTKHLSKIMIIISKTKLPAKTFIWKASKWPDTKEIILFLLTTTEPVIATAIAMTQIFYFLCKPSREMFF